MDLAFPKELELYRHWLPSQWLTPLERFPLWVAIAIALVGILLMLFGGGRLFRLGAAPLALALVFALEGPFSARMGLRLPPWSLVVVFAGLALLGTLAPKTFPPILGLLAGAMIGVEVVAPDTQMWGAAFGALCGAAVGFWAQRVVLVTLSCAAGGVFLSAGLVRIAVELSPASKGLYHSPLVAGIAAGFFFVAGLIFQLLALPSEQDRIRARAAKEEARRQALHDAENADRWASRGAER